MVDLGGCVLVVSNRSYTLYVENKIEVYNHTLANKLNKLLNTYNDYYFRKEDKNEPVFKFKQEQRKLVLDVVKG